MSQPNRMSPVELHVPVEQRVFDDLVGRVAVARGATEAAQKELTGLRERLGIPSMYGCAVEGLDEPQEGQIHWLRRQIDTLGDMCREVRGLAETLNAKL